MKLAIAAAAVAALAIVTPASAADAPKINWYGNLGYSYDHFSDANLGAVTARVGGRTQHWGGELEASTGLGDSGISGLPGVKAKVQDQYAAYLVGYLPVGENSDFFARVGYGHTNLKISGGGGSLKGGSDNTIFGVGGEWFKGANGVRLAADAVWDQGNGSNHSNTYSISYVRKF